MGVAFKQKQHLTSSFCLKPIASTNCRPKPRERPRPVPHQRRPSNHLTSSFSLKPLGSKKNGCNKRAQSVDSAPLEKQSSRPISQLYSSFSIRPHTPVNKRIRPLRRRIKPQTNSPLQSPKPVDSGESTTWCLISSFSIIPRVLKREQAQHQNNMQIKRVLCRRSSEKCGASDTFGSMIQKRKNCLMKRRVFSNDWMGVSKSLTKSSKKTPESVLPTTQKKRKRKNASSIPRKNPKDQQDNIALKPTFDIPRVHLGVRKSSRRRVKKLFDS